MGGKTVHRARPVKIHLPMLGCRAKFGSSASDGLSIYSKHRKFAPCGHLIYESFLLSIMDRHSEFLVSISNGVSLH